MHTQHDMIGGITSCIIELCKNEGIEIYKCNSIVVGYQIFFDKTNTDFDCIVAYINSEICLRCSRKYTAPQIECYFDLNDPQMLDKFIAKLKEIYQEPSS